jgi:hypothetical protein
MAQVVQEAEQGVLIQLWGGGPQYGVRGDLGADPCHQGHIVLIERHIKCLLVPANKSPNHASPATTWRNVAKPSWAMSI